MYTVIWLHSISDVQEMELLSYDVQDFWILAQLSVILAAIENSGITRCRFPEFVRVWLKDIFDAHCFSYLTDLHMDFF